MNLFSEYIKKYCVGCFIVAVLYACSVGSRWGLYNIVIDACVYGTVLSLSGLIYWNILRFAIPRFRQSGHRLVVGLGLALVWATFVVGLETFSIYLCAPDGFLQFSATIPARVFISLLIFIGIRLYFELYNTQKQAAKNEKEKDGKRLSSTEQTVVDRITVRNGQKIKFICLDEIIYIKADGDYIAIHTSEGGWLKEQTMKYTEKVLPPDRFVRIHRSYIVNINQISRIERYGERQQVVLHNNEKIKISAARFQTLKQLLGI